MPMLSGVYDSYYIQPVARIKENLAILSVNKWGFHTVEFSEPMPPGPAMVVDLVTVAGVTFIGANATIAKRIVAALQVNDNELLQLRWEPLDNVEGVLWELAGIARLASRNVHSRVDRSTRNWDPTLSTTQFWVLGLNRDMNLEARNPMGYALPAARFQFFGHRFVLKDYPLGDVSAADKAALASGDIKKVRDIIGPVTWLPAEGKSA